MINWTLFKREIRGSLRLLAIFACILTLYVTVIISMYDPKLMATLDKFVEVMPQIMAAVGMSAGATSLMGFMISYLYGFILLVFPMVFCMLRSNGLIARYIDRGSMVSLVAAPVKRRTIVLTQAAVLICGVFILLLYTTCLEAAVAQFSFPGALNMLRLVEVNAALLCLHLFIAGICFLFSCVFSEVKYSVAFGAGIPVLMYVLQMLANMGDRMEKVKYCTFFTLFNPEGLAAGAFDARLGAGILLAGAVALFCASTAVFCKKDLHI